MGVMGDERDGEEERDESARSGLYRRKGYEEERRRRNEMIQQDMCVTVQCTHDRHNAVDARMTVQCTP